LLEAGIQRHPGVELVIGVEVLGGRGVAVATAGHPVDVGVDPDVLQTHGGKAPGAAQAPCGDAALVEDLQGGLGLVGAADPVLHLGGVDVDHAKLVARRDVGRATTVH